MFPPGSLLAWQFVSLLTFALPGLPSPDGVAVEILEGIPDKRSWSFTAPQPVERYTEAAFGFVAVPKKFSSRGVLIDRSNPFVLRSSATITLPASEYRVL